MTCDTPTAASVSTIQAILTRFQKPLLASLPPCLPPSNHTAHRNQTHAVYRALICRSALRWGPSAGKTKGLHHVCPRHQQSGRGFRTHLVALRGRHALRGGGRARAGGDHGRVPVRLSHASRPAGGLNLQNIVRKSGTEPPNVRDGAPRDHGGIPHYIRGLLIR